MSLNKPHPGKPVSALPVGSYVADWNSERTIDFLAGKIGDHVDIGDEREVEAAIRPFLTVRPAPDLIEEVIGEVRTRRAKNGE
jgi:hypothetical protein